MISIVVELMGQCSFDKKRTNTPKLFVQQKNVLNMDNMKRQNFGSGAPWEDTIGYSRVVKVGSRIEVAGTTSVVDGVVVGKGDAEVQMRCILEKISKALEMAGSSLEEVVRTRIYTTDISKWEVIGKVHGEFFGKIKPVATMVGISALIDPDMIIEVEAEAVSSLPNFAP
jgi:enamine deaminase RidA (YjgF/YER057c/UK114 family)